VEIGTTRPVNRNAGNPMAQFSIADIEKVARLANLDLTAEEKAKFAGQFTAILDYFAKIQEVKLPPPSPCATMCPRLRGSTLRPSVPTWKITTSRCRRS
jgi:aspartyl/glutamyl-tRNA(Asn/Gln) amidotransferase C subunit